MLGEVVVRSDFQTFYFIIKGVFGGNDYHSGLWRFFFDNTQYIKTTAIRKHKVKKGAVIFIGSNLV